MDMVREFNGNNEPVRAYHGTVRDIESFLPLSHFGSYRASMERITSGGGTICIPAGRRREEFCPPKGKIYQVSIDIKNPIEIPDLGIQHSVSHFIDLLVQNFPHQQAFNALRDGDVTIEKLTAALKETGHDGFIYTNHSEDKGSKAYVILGANQVAIERIFHHEDIIKNLHLHGEGFLPAFS